jgi:hypothetical protein
MPEFVIRTNFWPVVTGSSAAVPPPAPLPVTAIVAVRPDLTNKIAELTATMDVVLDPSQPPGVIWFGPRSVPS